MNFKDAMEELKAGSKVSRPCWRNKVYFKCGQNTVNSYQPVLTEYRYTEDIMVSDGWLIDDNPTPMAFSAIIPFLRSGSIAKLEHWNDCCIFLDKVTKTLVLKSIVIQEFIPDFSSFANDDWEVIE